MNNLCFKKIIHKAQQSALLIIAIFSFFNLHADNIPLKYGDTIVLSQPINSVAFYLGAQINNNTLVLGAWKTLTPDISTKLYIQPGTATNRWGSNSNAIVQDGDFVRLEVASMANTATPGWLGYDFSKASGEQPAVFFPQTTNFSSSVPQGIILQICKINGSSSTTTAAASNTSTTGANTSSTNTSNSIIYCGDQVLFWGYTNSGGSSALSPLALEITANASSTTSANLMFSSSGTTSNPANYPNSDCWCISSIGSNASTADGLNNTIPQATAQNISSWASQTRPSLLGITTNVTIPLNYGDGVILQSANPAYGCYLAKSSFQGHGCSYIFGQTTAPVENPQNPNANVSKIIIEPGLYLGQTTSRIGTLAGQQVKSGDMIQFEFVSQPGYTPLYWYDGGTWHAQVATPYPTYNGVFLWAGAGLGNPQGGSLLRIYKKNASVGDPINQNDSVYFMGWSSKGANPVYLGTSGKAWQSGMEVYWIQTTNPIVSDIIWNITSIYPQAITSIQSTPPPGPWSYAYDKPTAGAWLTPTIGQWLPIVIS